MVSLEEALRALGFAKKGKGKPAGSESVEKSAPAPDPARKKTQGECSAVGLNDHAASFPSPTAHAARNGLSSLVSGSPPNWAGLDVQDPLHRLQSWEIDLLLYAEASALARRHPETGE